MARKSRRVKKRRSVRLSSAQMVQPGGSEVDKTPDALPSAAPVRSVQQESNLRDEYHYVITDLKRIGAIALVMLVVLIVLALLLT